MNHAFLILAHDSPELLERIINRLAAPNHFFFIHLDKKAEFSLYPNSERVIYLSGEDRIKVMHGGFSMILAEISLLRKAISYPSPQFDYFHLISGHDYPCSNNDSFDRFFEGAENKSFMHYDTAEQHIIWKEKIERRLNRWYLKELYINRYIRKPLELFLNIVDPKKVERELYAGWQWFSWHRSVVAWVLNYLDQNPGFLKKWRFSNCCDEVVFHTILYPFLDVLNIEKDNSLRYIDWRPKRPYKSLPLVLNEQDFQSIISSGSFFCRKVFIGESSKLLDLLDSASSCTM